MTQFIPGIYNKIIIKILGYFWGVTGKLGELGRYRDSTVATKILCHDRLRLAHQGCDLIFCVATETLQWGKTEVCRDKAFSVLTRMAVRVLRHGPWCRDKEAAWWNKSLSRQDFLCRDRVGRLVSRPGLLGRDRARLVGAVVTSTQCACDRE